MFDIDDDDDDNNKTSFWPCSNGRQLKRRRDGKNFTNRQRAGTRERCDDGPTDKNNTRKKKKNGRMTMTISVGTSYTAIANTIIITIIVVVIIITTVTTVFP